MVFDFIKGLGRSRVAGVQSKVQAKKFAALSKAKSKAATKFNNAVDAPMKAAKKKAQGAAKGAKGKAAAAPKKKGGNVGIFGRNKTQEGQPAEMMSPEMDEGAMQQTRAINVADIVDDRSQDCVGWVVAMSGDLKGRDFRLTPGKNVLGTSATCDIVLTDQYMSSRHSTINYDDGLFTLVDLDSTNGSYVNDKRVSREELIDNDKVRLGRSELKFKSLF